MILDYYHLREQPFGVTPDPRFWFASATHREALASILYGLESKRGFVALIARPGMGKTTVLFNGLHQLGDKMRTVFLFQQLTTPKSLLQAILADLGIKERQGDLTELERKLNDVCAEQSRLGKRIVLAIDEAQALNESVLEVIRMLSNFETPREKLIQIILSGQLQLAETLVTEKLVQLRQRIPILAHLKPLSESETEAYVNCRLLAAGYDSPNPLFTSSAMAMIAREGKGIPRHINNLCFNAMSVGFALKRRTIDDEVMREVIADLSLDQLIRKSRKTSKAPAYELVCDFGRSVWRRVPAVRTLMRKANDYFRQREQRRVREIAPKPTMHEAMTGLSPQSLSGDEIGQVRLAAGRLPGSRLFISTSINGSASGRRFKHISAYRAVAAAILLTTGASVLVMSYMRRDSAEAVKVSARAATPTSEAISSLFAATPALAHPSLPSTVTVLVKPGEFLEKICAEHFVSCTPELLEEILNFNPKIEDPDYIEVGQLIRIPAGGAIPAASTQSDLAARARRNTP